MSSPRNNFKDWLWAAWFTMQMPAILCLDLVDLYPAWLASDPGAPLHALHRLRAWYVATFNDPLLQWTPETSAASAGGGPWIRVFFWAELLFLLPVGAYGAYDLALARRRGTRPRTELLYLVYSLWAAVTALVCVNDIAYWDPAVYSEEQKGMFRWQIYGPYVVFPTLMFLDMYSRLLGRFQGNALKKTV